MSVKYQNDFDVISVCNSQKAQRQSYSLTFLSKLIRFALVR